MTYKIGFDIGSTTIKAVVLDENQQICYKSYERHKAQVRQKALEKIKELERYTKEPFQFAISGSGALGLCDDGKLPFVQEVFASATAIRKYYPDTDCAIELGGEDAKILFFKGSIEQRMNSTCAGGTGAFIDQMASLLDVDLETMNEVSLKHDKIYPIASRCGVFAKTDVQPLINQGVSKSNLSASIFQAVVDQTITSLAQGRNIEGNVLFLGGPLYFLSGLRDRFQETLKLADDQITCPDTAINFVALGAALCADKMFTRDELVSILEDLLNAPSSTESTRPLFEDKADYETFKARHHQSDAKYADLSLYTGKAYLGVDSGSTTTKLVLLNEDHEILYESYTSNKGDPLAVVRADLMKIYETNPNIRIYGSYATGYGEELMRHAFHLDGGIVETIAHYTAACLFNPEVDYILDIGGQDIKCFKIRDGRIDDIVLNEAENIVLSPRMFPEMEQYIGQDLIVTDGTTLLGADDKAGVAAIISAVAYLKEHPEIKHGKIRIGFTPDEEIGAGADHFDVEKFGCEFAYTVDGGEIGELEYENFNAAAAKVVFSGRNVHPGTAKDKMVNASLLAVEFASMLPADQRPETTEGYEGFFHLTTMVGSVEQAVLQYIVRDHSRELFELRRSLGIEFDIFLFPNNKDDGDFELLLENIARQDIHGERFFRCFSNYEECLSSHIGMDGQPMYLCPNRKAKVYSYITSMKLSNAERKMIGKGYWLFDNEAYWNLDSEYIVPLKEFLLKHKD